MPSPSLFVEALSGTAEIYLIAGALIIGVLLAALVLLAIVIRGEDAASKLGVRAPGPIAHRVRHMLNLHIYTGSEVPYGTTSQRRGMPVGYDGGDTPFRGTRRYHGPA